MLNRSRRSARQSITSPPTSSDGLSELARLIDALPPERLENVFTHPSWAADRSESYERLEFLGDSVLELAVARALYEGYPEFSEGQLAKARAHVVSRRSCAIVARDLGLGERLVERARKDFGEDAGQLARNRNVLAALLEAALAALLLEHGYTGIEQAVVDAFRDRIEYALTTYVDHKTELQEALARRGRQVVYTVVGSEGPPHERTFTIEATVDGKQVGMGKGPSKKDAEQAAAKEALAAMEA